MASGIPHGSAESVQTNRPGRQTKIGSPRTRAANASWKCLTTGTTFERIFGYPPLRRSLTKSLPELRRIAPDSKRATLSAAVDGQKIEYWGQFRERVSGSNGKTVNLPRTQGQLVHADVTPQQGVARNPANHVSVGVAVVDHASYRRVSFSDRRSRRICE